MKRLRLDFAHYPIKEEKHYEVEANRVMDYPFGQGYSKPDFTGFINYVIALNFNRNNLISSLSGIKVSYRFEKSFPEIEKNIIRIIMEMNSNGNVEGDLVKRVLEDINSRGCFNWFKIKKTKR